tara:strand:- start:349 stop:531 length:183 start_codon:yes stop_codon:yes gene_type:complete
MTIKYEIRKMKDVRITEKGIIFLYTFGRDKWLTYEQAVALQQKYEVCKSQLFPNERLVGF